MTRPCIKQRDMCLSHLPEEDCDWLYKDCRDFCSHACHNRYEDQDLTACVAMCREGTHPLYATNDWYFEAPYQGAMES